MLNFRKEGSAARGCPRTRAGLAHTFFSSAFSSSAMVAGSPEVSADTASNTWSCSFRCNRGGGGGGGGGGVYKAEEEEEEEAGY